MATKQLSTDCEKCERGKELQLFEHQHKEQETAENRVQQVEEAHQRQNQEEPKKSDAPAKTRQLF